jgi:nitroimidazol reductase NimA-like FMN-containing flavoprotein (pyridoxamine 5'-phosphate oxidase superfamily)
MIRDLTDEEINELLHTERYAHLACCLDNKPYVVPTTYAYDGKHIYMYTHNGRKVDMMRKNPLVCLQVENIVSESVWKSAMVYGTYEELKDESLVEAINMLKEHTRYRDIYAPFNFDTTSKQLYNRGKLIVIFRISMKEMYGRAHDESDEE